METQYKILVTSICAFVANKSVISIFLSATTALNILNKSENATPELIATYIQKYANQECN